MHAKDSSFSSSDLPHPISDKLIEWYELQKRSLPWRDEPDAYAVWVAEIMAQQTRLETMLPYFERWMQKFPDLMTLAQADMQTVLSLWEGLGYYQRARNLLKAARMIALDFDGQIPDNSAELLKLPGIGPYTAGAIASMAFGKNEVAVDGNAARVLARLFNIDLPINANSGLKAAWEKARDILPDGQASDFNQALMDLGANICIPRNPKCDQCPLIEHCEAFRLGIEKQLPIRKKASNLPIKIFASGLVKKQGRVLLRQRPEKGLLGGLWEFPNVETSSKKRAKLDIKKEMQGFGLEITDWGAFSEITHRYSHFEAQVHAFDATIAQQKLSKKEKHLRWFHIKELGQLPMGKIDRKIADQIASDVG